MTQSCTQAVTDSASDSALAARTVPHLWRKTHGVGVRVRRQILSSDGNRKKQQRKEKNEERKINIITVAAVNICLKQVGQTSNSTLVNDALQGWD